MALVVVEVLSVIVDGGTVVLVGGGFGVVGSVDGTVVGAGRLEVLGAEVLGTEGLLGVEVPDPVEGGDRMVVGGRVVLVGEYLAMTAVICCS